MTAETPRTPLTAAGASLSPLKRNRAGGDLVALTNEAARRSEISVVLAKHRSQPANRSHDRADGAQRVRRRQALRAFVRALGHGERRAARLHA